MNHCSCQAYIQEPGSNIADFAIRLTSSRVGEVRLANHKRLFDPREVALQLFVKSTKDFFCFEIALTPPISSSCAPEDLFALSSPIYIIFARRLTGGNSSVVLLYHE